MRLLLTKTVKLPLLCAAACIPLIGCSDSYEEVAVDKAKAMVRERLIDPGSAQFSSLTYFEYYGTVCGLVNSKNRMGGYGGRMEFLYIPGNQLVLEEYDGAMHSFCTNEEIPENLRRVARIIEGIQAPVRRDKPLN